MSSGGVPVSSEITTRRVAWSPMVAVLIFATAVRWIFYSGFFGSDEVTYTASAFKLLQGDWSVSTYVGANRYGINLPVAFMAWLFGKSEFSAAIYSVICSLAEIALVLHFGARMLGARAALLAGLLLASLPTHVHFAGRLMADAPLCLAITASFLFFYDGETRKRRLSWLLAGAAAGWSFWIKPVTIFYLGVLLVYPFVFRRFDWRWAWVALGFIVVVLANNLLFLHLTDRFWFLFETMSERRDSGYLETELAAGTQLDAPYYYLTYLFVKIYHTGLLGPLAAIGAARYWFARHRIDGEHRYGLDVVMWWGFGLLLILSILVVSFSPVVFVPKQTNYMLIFAAPLCMLGGYALAQFEQHVQWVLATISVVLALLFSALLQTSILAFTANSKAVLAFAHERPDTLVFANTNGYRAALFEQLVRPSSSTENVHFIGDFYKPNASRDAAWSTRDRFVVIDTETLSWGRDELIKNLSDVPACWVANGTLAPKIGGIGATIVRQVLKLLETTPLEGKSLAKRIEKIVTPKSAHVFLIPSATCKAMAVSLSE